MPDPNSFRRKYGGREAEDIGLQVVLTSAQALYKSRKTLPETTFNAAMYTCKNLVKRTNDDDHVRNNLGASPEHWKDIYDVFNLAIPVLDAQSLAVEDPSTGNIGSTSALMALNHDTLMKDLERLNDILLLARNVLASTQTVQDLAGESQVDQQVLKLIDLCVRVTARGYDGEAGSRTEQQWGNVIGAYKKLLITCLQFLYNFVQENEQRKLLLWLDLFANSKGANEYNAGTLPPGLGRDQFSAKLEEDWVNIRTEDAAEDGAFERSHGFSESEEGNSGGEARDNAAHTIGDVRSPEGSNSLREEINDITESVNSMKQMSITEPREESRENQWGPEEYVKSQCVPPTEGQVTNELPQKAAQEELLFGVTKTERGDVFGALRTPQSAAITLQQAKDQLMARLADPETVPGSTSENGQLVSAFVEGMYNQGQPTSDEEEDYRSPGEPGDQERGLLTDIPLVLGPQEIEALPMLIQIGICAGQGVVMHGRDMQGMRCNILLAGEPGRNLLRELLIFIAAWDLQDDETYFKLMMQIMEAILENGLMPYAYQTFGEVKDIVSPAQSMVVKILTQIFRGKQGLPPTTGKAAWTAGNVHADASRRVDIFIVRYIFTMFRQCIIPETCALIYLQGQIKAGHALPEDFPLNLWDMERVYEGVYQFLEFFAVLTESDDWKDLLVNWEIVSELVTLLRELEASIPKSPLNTVPQTAAEAQQAATQQAQKTTLPASSVPVSVAVERPFDIASPLPTPDRPFDLPIAPAADASFAAPSPLSQTSSQEPDALDAADPSDFEWRNLKKLVILVLSSLVWKSPTSVLRDGKQCIQLPTFDERLIPFSIDLSNASITCLSSTQQIVLSSIIGHFFSINLLPTLCNFSILIRICCSSTERLSLSQSPTLDATTAEAIQDLEEPLMLPPTVSTYSHKVQYLPPPPDLETLRQDLKTALRDAKKALQDVQNQEKEGHDERQPDDNSRDFSGEDVENNVPPSFSQSSGWYEIQGVHILDVVTLAIRAAKIYYTSHEDPQRLYSIKSERQIRQELYEVLDILKRMVGRNFAGGMREDELRVIRQWVEGIEGFLAKEMGMEEREKRIRDSWEWLEGSWEGRERERERLFLCSFMPEGILPEWTPVTSESQTLTPFLEALRTGLTLVHLHNALLKKSKRQFGDIKAFHTDLAKPYRCAENLRYWIKAAEIRWETKLKVNVSGVVNTANTLGNAADQIRRWLHKATEVLCGLDAEDDVEWAAAGGREGLGEVDAAIGKFEGLIGVYVTAIEDLQERSDISDVPGEQLKDVVDQMETILGHWDKVKKSMKTIKGQVELAMEWEELWNVVLGDIGLEMENLSRLVFEMEEARHKALLSEPLLDGSTSFDMQELDTIAEEGEKEYLVNRMSLPSVLPASPTVKSPTIGIAPDDTRLLALFARMQPLRASLDFLPMTLSGFQSRAEGILPTACQELESRRRSMEKKWKSLESDAEGLRQELGEDRWVTVFRNAGRQAQKLCESVERAIVKLQESVDAGMQHSNPPLLTKKVEAYEAKKSHYGPAIEKVLSIIQKGVTDRLTVNGEILRLHLDIKARWEMIKTDIKDMDLSLDDLTMNKNQQLRDSISSIVSMDRSATGSTIDTPGSSPASSVVMGPTNGHKRDASPGMNGTSRRSSVSLSRPNGMKRYVSMPAASAASTQLPRKTPALRSVTSDFRGASPSPYGKPASGTSTPAGRHQRPSLSCDSKPRWNSSPKVDYFEFGQRPRPSPLCTPTLGNRNSMAFRTPSSAGSYATSGLPLSSPLGRSSPAPTSTSAMLSHRPRLSSGAQSSLGLRKPSSLSPANSADWVKVKDRTPPHAASSKKETIRIGEQPSSADEESPSARPRPPRPSTSMAASRRISMLPLPKNSASPLTNLGGNASDIISPNGHARESFTGIRPASNGRESSMGSRPTSKGKDNRIFGRVR
ncbi:hypothetical protein P7C71_g2033, partial [Lecanoromycetidae sp. Uapishka_2]